MDLGLDFFSSLLSDDVVRRKPTLIDGSSAFYLRRNELHSPIDRDRAVYPLFKAEADSMEEVGGRARQLGAPNPWNSRSQLTRRQAARRFR